MKTNRTVRWPVNVEVLVALVAMIALGAFEVGTSSRWYRDLGAFSLQTVVAAPPCSTDLGAAVMWACR